MKLLACGGEWEEAEYSLLALGEHTPWSALHLGLDASTKGQGGKPFFP